MRLLLIFAASILLNASPAGTSTSRCYVPTQREALRDTPYVFVGKVLSLDDPQLAAATTFSNGVMSLQRPVRVRLAVERTYKGEETEEVEVG